jgi:hypothetical protein
MAPRRTYELVNAALNGKLPQILRAARLEGRTFDQIAHDLQARGVLTSRETVRRWCQDLEIEPAKQAS